MNRCSGCGYLLPGSWTVCQRCGTQVVESGAPALVGAAATAAPASASTAAPTAPADPARVLLPFDAPPRPPLVQQRVSPQQLAAVAPANDTLVPGSATPSLTPGPDNMLPPVRPQQPAGAARTPARSWDVAAAVRVGVAVIVVAVLGFATARVLDNVSGTTTRTGPAYASALPSVIRVNDTLQTAVHGTRKYFLAHGTYRAVSAARLRHDAGQVSWVSGRTAANWGEVSVRASGETTVVLASQVNSTLCAYARDDPIQSRTELAWDSGPCRASEAPASGWSPAN